MTPTRIAAVLSSLSRLLLVVLVTGAAHAEPVDDRSCSTLEFESARHVFHRTWFEQADAQFGDYFASCKSDALAYAYAAIIDKLLYRDIAANVEKAESLAAGVAEPDRLFVQALASFARGELEAAESQLQRYREAKPEDPYAAHVLGFTLTDLGRPADGARTLSALLAEHPDYNPARNHLAYALLSTDKPDEAMQVVDAFVAADPGNPSAWDTRAHILHKRGRSEEAIASLARGLLLDERFAYGFRHMGDLLATTGDEAAAKAAYRRAVAAADLYGPGFTASLEEHLED